MRRIVLGLGAIMFMNSCQTLKQTTQGQVASATLDKFYPKELVFPANISADEKVLLSTRVVPTPQQLAWQKLELTAFIHFGMNTFTGREWGDGKEDPKIFNPTDFNADQWVNTLKDSGFKLLIITAKHHDGFCLWPTKTTQHSVASSPWKNGKGDIVKEVKEACDKYGIKFGVYLSPWDRNAKSYGDSPKYNDMFVAQLTELLTQYGEIHEVWFDGANGEGPNGKTQVYDWKRFYKVIEELQPKAVKAIMGDDIRWVGNERGLGRATEWSVTPLYPDINQEIIQEQKALNISATAQDLGSEELVKKAKSLHWFPSEVDVSIRPGWFYHPEQDAQVKSLQQLMDIYYQSVGMNSVLLLNVPPDTRGKISEVDAARLREFGKYIQSVFSDNHIKNSKIEWKASNSSEKEFKTAGKTANLILLQEDITKGQRVEAFEVEAYQNGKWEVIATGTTIGYKRILKLEDCQPEKIKIKILKTRDIANISNVGLFYAPKIEAVEQKLQLNDFSKNKWKVQENQPLVIKLGENITAKAFTYQPLPDSEAAFKYQLSASKDGKSWGVLSKGEFSNIKNNPIPQTVKLDKVSEFSFVKFEVLEGADGGKPKTSIAQIGFLK